VNSRFFTLYGRTGSLGSPEEAGSCCPGVSAGRRAVPRMYRESAPVWPISTRRAPEREEAVDLLIAVRGAAGEVKMYAVLDRLGIGDRHVAMPAGAFSSVPMTISFSRSDRTFQPGACVQDRARPGRS
jgi:hypothetical protein